MKTTCTLAIAFLVLNSAAAAQNWKTDKVLFYEIRYTAEDAGQIPAIKERLQGFQSSFCKATGTKGDLFDASRVTIELHPSNSTTVQVGYAGMNGGPFQNNGKTGYRGTIKMPGPTAHDGKWQSTSGHPQDRRYFDKLLIHEVAPIYLQLLAMSNGGRFQGPYWFIQGTEEYLGVFHSTEYWRTKGIRYYHRRFAANPTAIDTDFGLNVRDPYNDGFLILNFMHDEFGEESVFKLIASREKTFGKRMARATGVTYDEYLSRFSQWRKRITSSK